jgi:hypothetical protein
MPVRRLQRGSHLGKPRRLPLSPEQRHLLEKKNAHRT